MARASIKTRRKVKAPIRRVSRTEAQLINAKYLGMDEPEFKSKELDSMQYSRMLNWYNYMSSAEESREWVVEFLQALDRKDDLVKLAKVPLNALSPVVGHVARIIARGYEPPTDAFGFINKHLDGCLTKVAAETPKLVKTINKPEIDRKLEGLLGDLEEILDTHEDFDAATWMADNKVSPEHGRKIADYFRPRAVELFEARRVNADPDLAEAYAFLSKKEALKRMLILDKLITAAEGIERVKKPRVPRKPRAKRPVTLEKKLKLVKIQPNSAEFEMNSVDPSKIIGASEVVLFNTKQNVITVLRGSLDINRTAIIGYDETRSVSKKIGRNAKQKLHDLIKSGTKRVEKIINDIDNNPIDIKDRLNENVMVVKVIT